MTKLGGNKVMTRSGRVLHFKSAKNMGTWERVAEAYKHGWRPGRKGKKSGEKEKK